MLISNLHKKGSEVSIKTRSTPASLSFTGQVTKHTTVKWTIGFPRWRHKYSRFQIFFHTALNQLQTFADLRVFDGFNYLL